MAALRIARRLKAGFLECRTDSLDEALAQIRSAQQARRPVSVGLLGNAAEVYPAILARGIVPDIVTDQTAAHDLVYGYVPAGHSLEQVAAMRRDDIEGLMRASRASIVRHVTAMLGFKDRGAVVFDNGNLIRTHAHQGGVERAFSRACPRALRGWAMANARNSPWR